MKSVALVNSDKKMIVDDGMFDFLSKFKWYYNAGYVRATINGKRVFAHRFLMNAKKGQVVDHKNRIGLDNRLSNLRFVTHQENTMNRGPVLKNSYSKFKGVTFDKSGKRKKRWVSACMLNGKTKTIGRFLTEIEAAVAYDNFVQGVFKTGIPFLNKGEKWN